MEELVSQYKDSPPASPQQLLVAQPLTCVEVVEDEEVRSAKRAKPAQVCQVCEQQPAKYCCPKCEVR